MLPLVINKLMCTYAYIHPVYLFHHPTSIHLLLCIHLLKLYYASIHPCYVSIQFILLQETAKDNRKPFEFFAAQIKLFSRICKVSY